jgi:hypothetical protein
MLGFYENFPAHVHRRDVFTSSLSGRALQQKLIQILQKVNGKNLSFLEVGSPSVPDCTVIFEWGIADVGGFTYIDEGEAKKILEVAAQEHLKTLDLFCGIRYYKNATTKKTPLRFDYYMMRVAFSENHCVEFQVFHERGPRYISPEELVNFLVAKVNAASARKTLKPEEPS